MKITISGQGMDLTQSLKEQVETKLSKLNKYFTDDTVANATLKTQKNNQIIEVTIPIKGTVLRVHSETDDMYKSIDEAEQILERQIRKFRTKIRDNKIHNIMVNEAVGNFSEEKVEDENAEIKIVKKKHFMLKPMDPIEACMQADLTDHTFFVFQNAETDNICVVYKRGDGAFGLIEPEVE